MEVEEFVLADGGAEGIEGGGGGAAQEDVAFVVGGGVAEADAHEESVELVLWERICALELVGVLCGDDHEGRVEAVDDAVDADVALVHGFEERSLGARGCSIDLIGEDEVGEDGPWFEGKLCGVAIEDGDAQEIRREHVGGELDAAEGALDGACDGCGEEGFADAGDVLDEEVSACEEATDDAVDGAGVADVHAPEGVAEMTAEVEHAGAGAGCRV